ncbi:MAG: hypothetical protein ACREAM_05085, partial [Blastocatellia bacterium]
IKVIAITHSISTIQRILHENELIDTAAPARTAYFPQPPAHDDYVLHLMDWALCYIAAPLTTRFVPHDVVNADN